MEALLFLILLFPLAGGTLNAVAGMRLPRALSNALAVAGVILSALLTAWLWPLSEGAGTRVTLFTWIVAGDVRATFGILFDRLAAPMALMVTVVSSLIHLYAVGYMKEEADYARFFALLNFFVFAMLTIVLADNLVWLFLGWEGVGFCSYALIGFWYREKRNADAGRKAFLVTRVGDVFLMVAIVWFFSLIGTVSIPEINARAAGLDPTIVTILALLLLGGAAGKSAQLPLMTWLPDAMAGPTPVSALIHAATMVTAGVYLLCRMFPVVSLSATALAVISVVGAGTALYAATCALAQREIKRVLAYSTMSQVGFMFLGVGAGTVVGAMFHLLTHAFFKAVLFMGAGCHHTPDRQRERHFQNGRFEKQEPASVLELLGRGRLPCRSPVDRRLLLQGRHLGGRPCDRNAVGLGHGCVSPGGRAPDGRVYLPFGDSGFRGPRTQPHRPPCGAELNALDASAAGHPGTRGRVDKPPALMGRLGNSREMAWLAFGRG